MAGGRLEGKFAKEKFFPKKKDLIEFKDTFLLDLINFQAGVPYLSYAALSYYDVLLGAHLL